MAEARSIQVNFHLIDPTHDRRMLQRADGVSPGDLVVVVVKCPHTIGLCYQLADGTLAQLPCPCNDRSEIVARIVPTDHVDGPIEFTGELVSLGMRAVFPGQVVHYRSRGSADGVFGPECRAAIVVGDYWNTADLAEPEHVEDQADLAVLNPTGLFFDRALCRSDSLKPGTWHWPALDGQCRPAPA